MKWVLNEINQVLGMSTIISISTKINAPIDTVWQCWTDPEHIVKWHHASSDWHAPRTESDFTIGGAFLIRMEAKDGSTGYDFSGRFASIDRPKGITSFLDDGRSIVLKFSHKSGVTTVKEDFEPEEETPTEQQKMERQTILNNFRLYVEMLPTQG